MGFNLELKRSSKQQPQYLNIVKERALSPQASRNRKYEDKLKVKSHIGPPYSDQNHELIQDENDVVRPKSSVNRQRQCVKGKATNDDELIKYMSKLPRYLQHRESGENLQEKALNVGVLDWARLERWKARSSNNALSISSSPSLKRTVGSSIYSGVVHSETLGHHREKPSSRCYIPDSSRKDDISRSVKPSRRKVIHTQDFECASNTTLEGQEKIHWTHKSNHSGIVCEKGMRRKDKKIPSETGNSSSNLGNYGISISPKKLDDLQESDTSRKNLHQKLTSEMRASSSKMENYGISLSSKEKVISGNGETKKSVEQMQESDTVFAHGHCPAGEHKNIVLLIPRKLHPKGSPEVFQSSEPRTCFDERLTEATQNSFSDCFSPEVHSTELCSEIPHSRPPPSVVETSTEPDINLISDQGTKFSKDPSHMSPCSEKTQKNNLNIKPTDSNAVDNSNMWDLETSESVAIKGRHPSPNRRFSFSLGRMGRSFSLKEGSAIPQLSSTYVSVKSGPVRSESCSDNSNRVKAKAHNKARSSPLRRFLDPLLKSKAATPLYSAETVQPLAGNLKSLNCRPIIVGDSLKNKKHVASTHTALLQLRIKNGLPLFKFVVDNNSNIFAATMKNLTPSGKDDSGQNYTFYSVNEIKKKSGGWIQGSREKSCGYAYNVIGEMKVSSTHFSDLGGQDSNNQFMEREFVLFGVEVRQTDEEQPKFMPTQELAAIVVKIPTGNLSCDGKQNDKDKNLIKCVMGGLHEDRCFCSLGENENSNNTIVILPEGVHGLPHKGAPSPLIDRWKYGGSCDCGGWDVGCNLRLLSNQNQCSKSPKSPKAFSMADRFELFFQEGAQQSRPIFSLAPANMGIYSVEFNASLSLMQAFFICVAVISSQKSFDLSEVGNLSEGKVSQEPTLNVNDGIKTPATVQVEVPAKYFPYPPLSPVGRV